MALRRVRIATRARAADADAGAGRAPAGEVTEVFFQLRITRSVTEKVLMEYMSNKRIRITEVSARGRPIKPYAYRIDGVLKKIQILSVIIRAFMKLFMNIGETRTVLMNNHFPQDLNLTRYICAFRKRASRVTSPNHVAFCLRCERPEDRKRDGDRANTRIKNVSERNTAAGGPAARRPPPARPAPRAAP
ncbi:hypothetical protein EVAR_47465_1 [Eumeta japonica]|uniref:Uncharacterized protein n=1 Tax=Eumeta variegata TaxID=151549 RepID=A0A4C1XEQ9_EUMVA|nr:hypothetical protein EVAR_47465_1 [Eumeta japonica]